MIPSNALSKKEVLFCWHCSGMTPERAAKAAGLSNGRAQLLLTRSDAQALTAHYAAVRGRLALQMRLAKESAALDCSPKTDLSALLKLSLDSRSGEMPRGRVLLSNVSEVKLSKDGGIEVKFFDRGKLLESLCGSVNQGDPSGQDGGLVRAVEESAKALWQK